ncbi:dermonecrotic toxin domain-containing protein [Pseudomonas atagonensis]|uniref:dermonecrotic toxin domain-containing protein n=1 Tax=Pseudomonas atagonensis TaxID=2609964 RepID=UPI001409D038|nr:DUF6543 domain-containing protein [Pseudomonas atagonensis]
MTEHTLPSAPAPAATSDSQFALLEDSHPLDENLLFNAVERWGGCRERFLELIADAPFVRASIHRMVLQELQLESNQVVLGFNATEERAQSFITLANACAFLQQSPDLHGAGNQPDTLVGLNPTQRLIYPSPEPLLKALKGLDLHTFLGERWKVFWEARALGTPESRRDLAHRLCRQHLEAAAQIALARGTCTGQALQPALAVINSSSGVIRFEEQAVNAWQLFLTDAQGRKTSLPGAFVMALETEEPVSQLLYVPGHPVALKSFAQRSAMEQWLLEQPQLFSADVLIDDRCSLGYIAIERPVESAIEQWTGLVVDVQMRSLRPGKNASMVTDGSTALTLADQQDRLRQTGALFAAPPAVAESPVDEADVPVFGLLNADIPLSVRRRAVERQHEFLENFVGNWFDGQQDDERYRQLKTAMQSLTTCEQSAHAAAAALLTKKTPLQMLELRQLPNTHYDDLYKARRDGLRAEASLQKWLGNISADEHRLLEAVLDHPMAANRTLAVSVMSLTLSATVVGENVVPTHSIDGAVLITAPDMWDETQPRPGVLLYCPGGHGGLQRFASVAELEHRVFKVLPGNSGLTLHLSPLQGDPFEFGLQNQLHRCEQTAAGLITQHRGLAPALLGTELEKLQIETREALRVPVNEAREQAYDQLIEQHRSGVLVGQVPTWLSRLSKLHRERFKTAITAYIQAMKRAHQLLERELPHRDEFSSKKAEAHIREDLALKQPFTITLDLPDSTRWGRTLTEGAAPGTPQKGVLIPSESRRKIPLIDLLQTNIDDPMWWRMLCGKIEFTSDSPAERETLTARVTMRYLLDLAESMNLAQKYDDLIVSTFVGSGNASVFSNEHRRECLIEPWRQMLKLQGDAALHQQHIDEAGWVVLNKAIDACTEAMFAADGKQLVLLPARLTVGGVDTNDGPSTLSGVTFIHEQTSGLTLLYLPESPDGRFFHQRDSLDTARKKLFELCLHASMVNYLAGRAVQGDFARHVLRINQSLIKHFDALIGVGTAWPATTSLAAHQLDAHMGRLLEAHRSTSRSNTDLYQEAYALKGGALFNYLKMALGMVPFVGTAIALYDAWASANLAVAAFLRGEVGHGLAELESVLLSLIDAAMDIASGVSVNAAAAPAATRKLSRTRQLKGLARSSGALHRPSLRKARHVADRFEGYEYEKDISLVGLQPVSEGLYRNVYRHAEGDFIIRQGRIYRVTLKDRTLRLYGTRLKSYQQPIAVDEAGHWDTHFAVYGTLFSEGLDAGGNVIGAVADGLDPLWPQALRQWLPRWWTDAAYRRQRMLSQTVDALTRQLDNQHRATNRTLAQYHASAQQTRLSGQAVVDAACVNDIELAGRQFAQLEQLRPLSTGNKRALVRSLQSQMALIVVNRHVHRIDLARERCLALIDEIGTITEALIEMPVGEVQGRLRQLRKARDVRIRLVKKLDQLDADAEQIGQWRQRIVESEHKRFAAEDLAGLETGFTPAKRDYIKTLNYLALISNFDNVGDPSWSYLQEVMRRARGLVYDALHAQQNLASVIATRNQRNRLLEECIEAYEQFRRDINVWSITDAQHFYLNQIPALAEQLDKMTAHARAGIKHGVVQGKEASSSGMRVFETDGNRLMIGVESIDPVSRQTRFTTFGESRAENWLPKSDGRYQRQSAPAILQPAPADNLNHLVAEARIRLAGQDDYVAKVRGYADQDMLPASLEDMLAREAAALTQRAQRITQLSPNHAVAAQLTDQAHLLRKTGRSLRITQTLKSKTPTAGHLDYLMEAATPDQAFVDIQKVGGLRELSRKKGGKRDFLQEYLVRDLTQNPPAPLWYAHFHYESDTPPFNEFVKAHLKLPEQRNLGLKWQQWQAESGVPVDSIWRGDINTALAGKHFQRLD